MPEKKWERIFDINVAAKVIKHISSGIYKTPGGAIKELVSNSFDAQATKVEVDTGSPEFKILRVKDNGIGLTPDMIDRSFEHVGASLKVSEPEFFKGRIERQLIGQFGIGMLASAHISKLIRIETYPEGESYGMEIMLNLEPYFEYEKQIQTLEEFTFGTVQYRHLPRAENQRGTLIELTKIEPQSNFYKTISRRGKIQCVAWPLKGTQEAASEKIMERFVSKINSRRVPSVQYLPGRERILWDLGILCPVEYLDNGPIDRKYLESPADKIIEDIRRDLEKLEFKLYFDGVQVRKPIQLPTQRLRTSAIDELDEDRSRDFKVFSLTVDETLSDKSTVTGRGYIFYQPYRIYPQELQGLYARQRFVGVGKYDSTFFNILEGESAIFRAQISGELYIKSGLDDALNLDRSGFMEIDEGWQILYSALSKRLQSDRDSIVRLVRKASGDRIKRRHRIKSAAEKDVIISEIKRFLTRQAPSYSIHDLNQLEVQADPNVISYGPIAIDHHQQRIFVSWKKSEPKLIEVIFAFDRLLGEIPDSDKLRSKFATMARQILSLSRG